MSIVVLSEGNRSPSLTTAAIPSIADAQTRRRPTLQSVVPAAPIVFTKTFPFVLPAFRAGNAQHWPVGENQQLG